MNLEVKAIYAMLAEKYKLRSKWKKKQHLGELTVATKPREVIQMDTVHFGMIFTFTSINTFSKDVSVGLYPTLTSMDGRDFLQRSFIIDFIIQNFSKQMEDLSSRESLNRVYLISLSDLGLPGLTRKMKSHILNYLTDL